MMDPGEIMDEYIGDVARYSPGGNLDYFEMEPDIDGEWVRAEAVEAAILRKLTEEKKTD